ncbi:MAG: uroporphyrinogen decarboxylase family protein [Dehalobacterium sp.]
MDRAHLYEERITRISKAIKREKPDRVPIVLKMYSWVIQYYGYSMEEFYISNPDTAVEMYTRAADEFGFDGIYNVNNVTPLIATNELGGGVYVLGSEGIQVSNLSAHIMKPDEYSAIAEDFTGYLRDNILPRRFKKLSTGDSEAAFQALKSAYEKFVGYMGRAIKGHGEIEKAGCPVMWGQGVLMNPLDYIMDYLRDFSGIITDLRRQPELVFEAANAMQKHFMENVFSKFKSFDDGHGVFWPMHLAPYLKPKDFEKFYYPYLKETLEYCIANKIYASLLLEGNWEPYFDILQDLPDNDYLIGSMEKGDYRTFKEKLGKKMAICGGIPLNMLAYKSKEECVEHTKKLLDECAGGGGFIVDTDMSMMRLNDAKPENLKAVIDTVIEYGKY